MANRYQIGSAVAVLGGLMLLGVSTSASAQDHRNSASAPSLAGNTGSLHGEVRDERDDAVKGAIVTAIGAEVAFVLTDNYGRFALTGLPAGTYTVQAHLDGFSSTKLQRVNVQARTRSESLITLRRASVSYPTLAAGFGASGQVPEESSETPVVEESEPAHDVDAHSEVVWRVRNARRGVLKDAQLPLDVAVEETAEEFSEPTDAVGRRSAVPSASLATNLFADMPLSGEVNLLTSGSLDDPEQLFSSATGARGVAYVRVGAPVGTHGSWTMRGALTQADLSTWFIDGSYSTRAEGRDGYDVGLSYSTQRYDGGNFLALRDVSDGSRNVGTVYAVDMIALSPRVSITYGGRYDRFDYLNRSGHFSPRVEVALMPSEGVRLGAAISSSAHAPGAEEFLPPGEDGIWMLPQRTFSPFEPARGFEAERATNVAVTLERDFGPSTLAVRAFQQDVSDQLITVFGTDVPGSRAHVGHYLVGNAGHVDAIGCSAEYQTSIADRFRGTVAYSLVQASLTPTSDSGYLILFTPSSLRSSGGRIHDVSTSIEADVPETATRVLVLYRASTGFVRPVAPGTEIDGTAVDSRFDVQVRQSLPFVNFYGAELEMLVAVRNFFKDATGDQPIFDELFVVNPPKQIVGGVTLHF